MNFFPGWLKAVLAVVVLALLTGDFSFHRIQERRVRRDVASNPQSIAKFNANQSPCKGVEHELSEKGT
ncbi:MAG: hypothetical protein ABSD77_02910 [Verrucomicrobiota bacterium]|jgi:hypothetical protein